MAAGRGKHSGRNGRFTACNMATLRQKAGFFARFRWCRRWRFLRAGFMRGGSGLARKSGTSERGRERFRCRDSPQSIYRRRKHPPRQGKRKAEYFHAMPSKVRRRELCTTSGIFVNLVVGSFSPALIPQGFVSTIPETRLSDTFLPQGLQVQLFYLRGCKTNLK